MTKFDGRDHMASDERNQRRIASIFLPARVPLNAFSSTCYGDSHNWPVPPTLMRRFSSTIRTVSAAVVLHQEENCNTQPLAFFLKTHHDHIFVTWRKRPRLPAFRSNSDHYNEREVRQIDFQLQFSTDFRNAKAAITPRLTFSPELQ